MSKSKPKHIDIRPLAENGLPILPPHTKMEKTQFLQSANKQYRLVYENDTGITMYDGESAIWSADGSNSFVLQSYPKRQVAVSALYLNYHLVLLDAEHKRDWQTTNSTAIDDDAIAASFRTFLLLQDDGNILIIDPISRWSTNSVAPISPALPATFIPPGITIAAGQNLTCGIVSLNFQEDGNLVLFGPDSQPTWSTNTQNKGGIALTMQPDGNLTITASDGSVVWHSQTSGNHDAYARLQSDGTFSIINDKVVWARFGFTPIIKSRRVFYPGQSTTEWSVYKHMLYQF